MIDTVKRKTIKRIGLGAVAATTAGFAGHSLAAATSDLTADTTGLSAVSDIQLHTRVSAVSNDLEVVITNAGSHSTTITQLTPSVTVTPRGQFNFDQLMDNGPVVLAPGQSVNVLMRPHAFDVSVADSSAQQAGSLTDALRRSFSVLTEDNSFAKITVNDSLGFA